MLSAQTSSGRQAFPQAPQWLRFESTSTHCSPHFTNPGLQVKSHVPTTHWAVPFAGIEHVVPQTPQLRGSAAVSAQAPPHWLYPVSHTKPHAPVVQVGCA
jgi:hypothetical protein